MRRVVGGVLIAGLAVSGCGFEKGTGEQTVSNPVPEHSVPELPSTKYQTLIRGDAVEACNGIGSGVPATSNPAEPGYQKEQDPNVLAQFNASVAANETHEDFDFGHITYIYDTALDGSRRYTDPITEIGQIACGSRETGYVLTTAGAAIRGLLISIELTLPPAVNK